MPERPGQPDFVDDFNRLDERLRQAERHRHPEVEIPPFEVGVMDEGVTEGLAGTLDFVGSGVIADVQNGRATITISGGGSGGWDAVVDSELVASDPAARLFKGIGEALTYLRVTVGLTERANVFVRHRSPSAGSPDAYIETGNVTAPDHVFLFAQPADMVPAISGNYGTDADVTWDHAGFSMTAVSWIVQGLRIHSGNKSTLFGGIATLLDCDLERRGWSQASGPQSVSSETTLIRCSAFDGWFRFTQAYDCKFRIYTPGTYNPGDGTLVFRMLDCEVQTDTLLSDPVTWQLNAVRTDIRLVEHWNAGGSLTMSLGASFGRYLIVNNDSSAAITVTNPASAYRVDLRGFFQAVTVGAPQSNNRAHSLDVACTSLDVTGPALLDCHVQGGGGVTVRGDRVTGHVAGLSVNNSGAWITYVSATRSRIDGTCNSSGASGTFKAFSFDAGSSNNLLVMHRTSEFPAAGTDAGTNNVVLPYVIEDEGTAIAQRKTLNFVGAGVTVTDAGGKNVITIPGAGSSGHVIEDEGVPLAAQPNLNFVGAGVTVTDATPDTVVTIPGGGHTIEDEGVALAQQTVMNFVGAGVVATDAGGKTVVTISGGGGGGGDTLVAWIGL